MSFTRALVPEPVSLSGSRRFDVVRGFSLTPQSLAFRSCPWPRSRPPMLAPAALGADFLVWDIVDEWGAQSFPASDPPANW
jgi:hypothetical protein